MGGGLAKLNELKNSINNTVAFMKGDEPETGYLGSPPIKFPKTEVPLGCSNLDLRASQGKIPEVISLVIYECLDELKNDGSYRFAGVEINWRCKMTGQLQRVEQMSGEKDGCRKIEVGSLDYIKKVRLSHKEHEGVNYVSFCGIECNMHDPAGAGDLKLPVKECVSTNTEFTEGVLGLRLVVHKKLKVIVDLIPFFARVADKKTIIDATRGQIKSFLAGYDKVEASYGTKIYDYKVPESKYEDFSTFITNGRMDQEFLGGLPIRLLGPEESARWLVLRDKHDLKPLCQLLKEKGSIHHLKLEPDMEDRVVNFIVAVLLEELFNKAGEGYENNIRFCMKMLCIVYNDDKQIWKRVQEKVEQQYKQIGGTLFDKAMAEVESHHTLKSVQEIQNIQDEEVKKKFQKACPQCPDDGTEDDVEKIAKKYMMDAASYLQDFHGFFKSLFPGKKKNYGMAALKKPTTYHGAPTVKGLDRIKAKCQEYQDKDKLSASDSVARTMDYLRGTVECHDLHELFMAYQEIKKNCKGDFKIVRLKNGFQDLKEKSYKSILLNIMIYNTQIAEVQITLYAFKEGNDVNHFIYEVQREHNLYDMVSKNLNLAVAFKDWIEPIAPDSMHEIWPKNRTISIKGYLLLDTDKEIFSSARAADPSKRRYLSMSVAVDKDNKLTGSFGIIGGQYKLIEGESKLIMPTDLDKMGKNIAAVVDKVDGKAGKAISDAFSFGKKIMDTAKSVSNKLADVGLTEKQEDDSCPRLEWRMLEYGSMEKESGTFKGKFVDETSVEGTCEFQNCDPMGNINKQAPITKGTFRLWVDDGDLPGLNPTTLAFREVMKTSNVIRKKYIPGKKAMEWKGALSGSYNNKDEALSLQLKVESPLNFPYTSGINGKGKCGKEKLRNIAGYHANYENVRINLFLPAGSRGCFDLSGPRTVVCTGRFLEDLKIIGTYDDKGHMGRFTLDCVDQDAIKKFGPRPESEKGRYDLIIIYKEGYKHYCQIEMKTNPDQTVTGSGLNFDGEFKIEGKHDKKSIIFTKTQTTKAGATETLTFDGMFVTAGVYDGQFRSDKTWGKFKLRAC